MDNMTIMPSPMAVIVGQNLEFIGVTKLNEVLSLLVPLPLIDVYQVAVYNWSIEVGAYDFFFESYPDRQPYAGLWCCYKF
jgi:hypothetical protein